MTVPSKTPRAYTPEEVRELLLQHFHELSSYWANIPLDAETLTCMQKVNQNEVEYRLSGFVHSLLVTLDGGTLDLPAFDLIPSPHESDREFHEKEGSNWFEPVVVNDCQLHELWHAIERRKS